ncbi:hypothetical protein PMIN06_009309 [Paraphaeosphaeria minitans]
MAHILSFVSSLAYFALLGLSSADPPYVNNRTYEYIVVGSGPGGGPLAANLARAGHSVLLFEAGDDQTENLNVSQWNPDDVDWNKIAETTGDESWSAENMRKYLVRLEKAHYNSSHVHGHDGWLDTTMLDSGYAGFQDARELTTLAALAAGYKTSDTTSLLTRDMNGNQTNRDNLIGPFGGVSHINPNGRRSSPGYYVRDTVAENKYPLTLSLDTLATKIIFKSSGTAPRKKAAGIEYIQGKSLHSADPRSNASVTGKPGKVYASREVIISGGAFNTPQLLLLSGIGPRKQLEKFKIPVIADLPGVG